jgi:lipopolysaccharide/colanic/teichoic acid biosynthesis glycosyltransferase
MKPSSVWGFRGAIPGSFGRDRQQRMKRTFDSLIALIALTLLSPVLAAIAAAVWLDDRHPPFFFALRVARGGGDFRMVKFRTMIPNAWKSGVNSTASGDARITRIGTWLRKRKLDELPQLWNVLTGDMSLVGPRPQVRADVNLYTAEESRMLQARPGITDLASIAFADEGEILAGSSDPDLLYNQIIRPWKSRLILLYLENQSFFRDLEIVWITVLALFSRRRALRVMSLVIDAFGAGEKLKAMATRRMPLEAWPPPGTDTIVRQYAVMKEASARA